MKTEWLLPPRQRTGWCGTIALVAELPRTENGKVRKSKLREQGVPAGCRDGAARAS